MTYFFFWFSFFLAPSILRNVEPPKNGGTYKKPSSAVVYNYEAGARNLQKNKRRTIFLEKVKKESEQKCRDRSSADYDTNDATLDICVNFLLTF